jgi:hypothetical protein
MIYNSSIRSDGAASEAAGNARTPILARTIIRRVSADQT